MALNQETLLWPRLVKLVPCGSTPVYAVIVTGPRTSSAVARDLSVDNREYPMEAM